MVLTALFLLVSGVRANGDISEQSSLLQVSRFQDINAGVDSIFSSLVRDPSSVADKINQMTATDRSALLSRAAQPDQWFALAKQFDSLPLADKNKLVQHGEASVEMRQIFDRLPKVYRQKILELLAEYHPSQSDQMEMSLLAKGSRTSEEATGSKGNKKSTTPPPEPAPEPAPEPESSLEECPTEVGDGKCAKTTTHEGACFSEADPNGSPQCILNGKLDGYQCPKSTPMKCKFAAEQSLTDCPSEVGDGKCAKIRTHEGACYKETDPNGSPQCILNGKLDGYQCPKNTPMKCKFAAENSSTDCPTEVGDGKCAKKSTHEGACYNEADPNGSPQCILNGKLDGYQCPNNTPTKCKFP